MKILNLEFQPTLPARGATCIGGFSGYHLQISTHAPRTGSDLQENAIRVVGLISTHAPRTGSDIAGTGGEYDFTKDFNPRSPHGERLELSNSTMPKGDFNPRSPHGERRPRAEL